MLYYIEYRADSASAWERTEGMTLDEAQVSLREFARAGWLCRMRAEV